ncbi:M4 family metallopeptidase [Flavilitoribacter nigricans]|uniref:Neutral protease n=1 Tax=Flavilitoribacter nigricans (strain ATCC 23147 / DSM 23189 / NBRC 102662 / NCIMB 1420 / SS-2) TaxID=1122177 RepID=A0A2D0N7V6_FLAN2|nr:M4 family metallopeptidase [Flavilitoribacter nigricans]PHN04219.1 neutral protease [Flavilitoribacter nigricans DSM 23189 = NBRC 102662]
MKTFTLRYFALCGLLFSTVLLAAQIKPHLDLVKKNTGPAHRLEDMRIQPFQPAIPTTARPFDITDFQYRTLPHPVLQKNTNASIKIQYTDRSGTPAAIYGETSEARAVRDTEQKIFVQLKALREYLRIENPGQEFRIVSRQEGKNGYVHYKLQQYLEDVPVYGGELTIHLRDNEIELLNGSSYPTPKISRVAPAYSVEKAQQKAMLEARKITPEQKLTKFQQEVMGLQTFQSELFIHYPDGPQGAARLVWRVEVVPNVYHREAYFIDAHTGDVLRHQSLLCKAHSAELPFNGPAVGTATDLLGQNRTINSYEIGGTYLMIDASRPMFNSSLQFDPADPRGVIWTLDAEDQTPIENDSFSVAQILGNSPNDWDSPIAVSAHYNAGQAYEYFRSTFGRNSINGRGGTIVSIINVTDEDSTSLENAFWSGSAMFYGNGGDVFQPLARALDVAGHEMSHGVVQTTANLEYLSQSGALNESFADIFGAMIDRDNWQIGEDIVSTNFFPSGALRDLSNPHNGTNNPNQHFWQPEHMDEYVDLPETEEGDNGGVHINSGIPNRAYYLFATAVGKDVAEQVYYNALDNYLTRFAQFSDLRISVLASAGELYNNSVVQAAASAFDQVGITEEEASEEPEDVQINPGNQVVLFASGNRQALNLYNYNGEPISEPFIDENVISKPSVSDDGSIILFVDNDQNIQLIEIDWLGGTYTQLALTDDGRWRTAAISKDGRLLAALTDDFDDQLYIYRLDTGDGRAYTLDNPTTAEGISTGTVAYADILEWGLNGSSVMYDAKSTISKVDGTIEFWDIGFIDVWDPNTDNFGSGYITKLFTGLPEGVSVGNPTFSKNSPFIIALDYIDETEGTYSMIGVNVVTGETGHIFNNSDLSFPNYSVDDSEIIFDGFNSSGNRVLGRIALASDKINRDGDAFIFISGESGARWGIVFATGDRELSTDTEELEIQAAGLKAYPNPVQDQLQIELESPAAEMTSIRLFDPLGRNVYSQQEMLSTGLQKLSLPLGNLSPGNYVLDIRQSNRRWVERIVKLR